MIVTSDINCCLMRGDSDFFYRKARFGKKPNRAFLVIFRFTGLVHENALQILLLILSLILKAFRLVCKSMLSYVISSTASQAEAMAA